MKLIFKKGKFDGFFSSGFKLSFVLELSEAELKSLTVGNLMNYVTFQSNIGNNVLLKQGISLSKLTEFQTLEFENAALTEDLKYQLIYFCKSKVLPLIGLEKGYMNSETEEFTIEKEDDEIDK